MGRGSWKAPGGILQDLPELGSAPRHSTVVRSWAIATKHWFTVDEVAATAGDPPPTVLARLLDLELSGQIQRIGGAATFRVLT